MLYSSTALFVTTPKDFHFSDDITMYSALAVADAAYDAYKLSQLHYITLRPTYPFSAPKCKKQDGRDLIPYCIAKKY